MTLTQITNYPGGKNGYWYASCEECGYSLRSFHYRRSSAQKSLDQHNQAKHPDTSVPPSRELGGTPAITDPAGLD